MATITITAYSWKTRQDVTFSVNPVVLREDIRKLPDYEMALMVCRENNMALVRVQ